MTTVKQKFNAKAHLMDSATRPRTVKTAAQGLQVAYRQWRDFLSVSLERSVPRNDDEAGRVVACFRSLGTYQPATLDRARRMVLAIDRSRYLLKSALAWETPCIGVPGNPTGREPGHAVAARDGLVRGLRNSLTRSWAA